ncbi:MAG: SPOR domain-containing protein [Chitinophagaceae bacterium]|nr:SPOR domain-containing protein [Chitinophagaceae bacterium]MCW5905213.1 SPOR domain-containing protein [Chitinophagaceae bacterium]
MKALFSIVILCLLFSISYANDTIIVRKDHRLDILAQKQMIINKRSSMLTSTGQYKGFRIQVISTRDRENAFSIKADLLTKFPEEKVYVMFQSPNFKVRIGNFITREDAEKLRKPLNKMFKNGVFIVEDVIDYIPPADEEF